MHISEYKNIFDNEEGHFFYRSTHNLILQLIKIYKPKTVPLKILDAGCGTGLLAKKMESLGEVTGIDSNPEAIKFARKRGVKNLVKGSINKLPFKDNSFDVVTSIDVIYHKDVDAEKALKEFRRVLKSTGILVVKVPAFEILRGSHDLVVKTKRRYTKNDFYFLFNKSKLSLLKISYFFSILFFPMLAKRYLEKMRNGPGHSDISNLSSWTNKVLTHLAMLEVWSLKFINLPLGVSLIAVAKKQEVDGAMK